MAPRAEGKAETGLSVSWLYVLSCSMLLAPLSAPLGTIPGRSWRHLGQVLDLSWTSLIKENKGKITENKGNIKENTGHEREIQKNEGWIFIDFLVNSDQKPTILGPWLAGARFSLLFY